MFGDQTPQPDLTEEQLKAYERSQITADLLSCPLSNIDKKQRSFNLTPVEQQLIGGTAFNFIYAPNEPKTFVAGVDLESINRVRSENPNLNFQVFAELPEQGRQGLKIQASLKPLSREQVESGQPEETFDILGSTTYLGEPLNLSVGELRSICQGYITNRRSSVKQILQEEIAQEDDAKSS